MSKSPVEERVWGSGAVTGSSGGMVSSSEVRGGSFLAATYWMVVAKFSIA